MRSGSRRSTSKRADVVIIGAGAAGLAAAAQLVRHDLQVTLVEARDRIGGRIYTERVHASPVPVELGAEFIHGESASVFGQLQDVALSAVDVSGERWSVEGGRLTPAEDRLGDLQRGFKSLTPPQPDVPFAAFLERHARRLTPPVVRMARSMVEGFDAADATRISAREVLDEWSGPAAAGGSTFRPLTGYGPLLDRMLRALPPERATLRLSTVVESIDWRRGRVVISGSSLGERVRIEATRAIVTLPLGVLQTPEGTRGHVRFEPALPHARRVALGQLASGPVIKLLLQFAAPFWTELEGCRYRNAAFFFTPDAPFPTFWTSLPVRSPLLVAWCAGPRAQRWAGATEAEMYAGLRASLRTLFGRRDYGALLERVSWHDWQADPYARGAYSYVLVNGSAARGALARPLVDTLYFAGEASDTTGEAATVGGAFNTGIAAATRIVRALERRRK
jgi:monoamine oxidase